MLFQNCFEFKSKIKKYFTGASLATMQPFVTISCESSCQATLAGVSNVLCSPTISSDLVQFITNPSARNMTVTVQQGIASLTMLMSTIRRTLSSYTQLIDQVLTQFGMSSTNATIIAQIDSVLTQVNGIVVSAVTSALGSNGTVDPATILEDFELITALINSTGLIKNMTQFNMIVGQLQQFGGLIAQALSSANVTAISPIELLSNLNNIGSCCIINFLTFSAASVGT
jgi:hypothetical protein